MRSFIRFNYHSFTTRETGASLVEFVIVFPILITIILTMLEFALMLAIKVNLQSITQSGAYYGAAGSYTTGSTRTASAQAVMTSAAAGFLNPTKLTMTIQSFPTFAVASLGLLGATGTGSAGQVGMYQAQYVYTPTNPIVAGFVGATRTLLSTTYTKNAQSFSP